MTATKRCDDGWCDITRGTCALLKSRLMRLAAETFYVTLRVPLIFKTKGKIEIRHMPAIAL